MKTGCQILFVILMASSCMKQGDANLHQEASLGESKAAQAFNPFSSLDIGSYTKEYIDECVLEGVTIPGMPVTVLSDMTGTIYQPIPGQAPPKNQWLNWGKLTTTLMTFLGV